jgi:hypothetical protein
VSESLAPALSSVFMHLQCTLVLRRAFEADEDLAFTRSAIHTSPRGTLVPAGPVENTWLHANHNYSGSWVANVSIIRCDGPFMRLYYQMEGIKAEHDRLKTIEAKYSARSPWEHPGVCLLSILSFDLRALNPLLLLLLLNPGTCRPKERMERRQVEYCG